MRMLLAYCFGFEAVLEARLYDNCLDQVWTQKTVGWRESGCMASVLHRYMPHDSRILPKSLYDLA